MKETMLASKKLNNHRFWKGPVQRNRARNALRFCITPALKEPGY